MANKKITELDAATSLASTDVLPVVDVSEDVTKKITATNLFRTLPDGTAAAPALAFSSDAANGVYLAGTDTVGISTGGTQRVTVDGSGNVTISGDLQVDGATTTVQSTTVTIDDKNIELGSVASPSNTTADGGGITLKGATDKTIKWINSTGYWTFNTGIDVGGNIELADNSKIKLGTGDDLQIYHDGTNSIIDDAGTGNLILNGNEVRILSNDNSENAAKFITNGAVELYHDGSKKFETKSDGVDVTGEVQCDSLDVDGALDIDGGQIYYDAANNNLHFIDNVKARFGTGSDLRIYHDGNNSFIDEAGTGQLFIRAHDRTNIQKYTGETCAQFIADGAVNLYHDGTIKFSTKSDGIDVAGEVQCDSLDVDGSATISGTASTLLLLDSSNSNGGSFRIKNSGNDKHFFGSAADFIAGGSINQTGIRSNEEILFSVGGQEKARFDSSGNLGVNTTSPGAKLEVKDTTVSGTPFKITGANNYGYSFRSQSAGGIDGARLDLYIGSSSGTYSFTNSSQELLRIDSSGRLGVGASNMTSYDTSAQNLLVSDTSSNCGITIRSGGGTPFGMIHFADGTSSNAEKRAGRITYGHSGDFMTFNTADSEAFRIDSSGRLLLGTTTEGNANADNLTIADSANSGLTIRSGSSNIGSIFFSDATSGTGEYAGFVDYNHSSDKLSLGTASTTRVYIDSSGNVGIGDAAPSEKLNVAGNVMLEGGDQYLYLTNVGTGNSGIYIRGNTSGSYLRSHSTGVFTWEVTGSEKMRLDSSGRLLLGTTTEGVGDADEFTVAGSGNIGMTIRSGSSSSGNIFFSDGTSGTDEYDGYIQYRHGDRALRFATTATERFRITSTGAWAIEGASNYGTSGQVLTSNGNDAPTWQDAAGGGAGGANAISMNDNVKINFGDSNDLQIYHDGSNSYIDDAGTGNLKLNGNEVHILSNDNSEYCARFITNGAVRLFHDNSKKFETKSDGVDIIGELQCDSLDVDGAADITGVLSSSEEIRVDRSGATNLCFTAKQSGTTNASITAGGTGTFSGLDVDGNADISGNIVLSGDLDLQDSNSIKLGTGDDFHLIHNGSNTHLENYTGGYLIDQNADDGYIALRSDNGSGGLTNYVYCDGSSGVVNLGYYGSTKLQTKSDGVDVSGELQCDSLDCDGGGDFTGGVSFRGGTGAVDVRANSDIRLENGTWTGNAYGKIQHHNNTLYIGGGTNGIIFRESGTDRALIDGSGHFRPASNNTYDLGTSANRWRNVYTHDLHLSNEGQSNDVDGTWGNYTIQEGEDDLFLINRRNGKKYKFNLTEVS